MTDSILSSALVGVTFSDLFVLTKSGYREWTDSREASDAIAELKRIEDVTVHVSQTGLEIEVTVALRRVDPRLLKQVITVGLAASRSVISRIAEPLSMRVTLRFSPEAAALLQSADAVASWLAPCLIMLTCRRPAQQLHLAVRDGVLSLTMPFQPEVNYAALLCPTLVGIIATFAVGKPVSGRLAFDRNVSADEGGGGVIIASLNGPFEAGRPAVLKARVGRDETDITAQRALMNIYWASEPAIAAFLDGNDLERLRDRLMGAEPLPVDAWAPVSTNPNVPAPPGQLYAAGAPGYYGPDLYGPGPAGFVGYGLYSYAPSTLYGAGGWPGSYGYYGPYGYYGAPTGVPEGLYSYGPAKITSPGSSRVARSTSPAAEKQAKFVLRIAQTVSAALVAVVLVVYLVAVIEGWISSSHRLGLTELGILVVGLAIMGLLVYPALLDRISRVSLGGVDLELTRLQRGQEAQQDELRRHRFVLLLLLGESERRHLRELQEYEHVEYIGNPTLRTELRRLRGMGLIRNRGDHVVRDLADGKKHDITEFVELTDAGLRYLNEIKEDADTTT